MRRTPGKYAHKHATEKEGRQRGGGGLFASIKKRKSAFGWNVKTNITNIINITNTLYPSTSFTPLIKLVGK